MSVKKITLTKRQLRALFRKVFKGAGKMSYLLRKGENKQSRFIEDDALEYIMMNCTDRAFGEKSKNKKNHNAVFRKFQSAKNEKYAPKPLSTYVRDGY